MEILIFQPWLHFSRNKLDNPSYSLIVPVFNRPDEIRELLQSLSTQTFKDYELVLVEDGSSIPCEEELKPYQDTLNIRYFFKENAGPSKARNFGMEQARGDYFLFLEFRLVGFM